MGFGDVPSTRQAFPEVDSAVAHLREVLGGQLYESFVRAGAGIFNDWRNGHISPPGAHGVTRPTAERASFLLFLAAEWP